MIANKVEIFNDEMYISLDAKKTVKHKMNFDIILKINK